MRQGRKNRKRRAEESERREVERKSRLTVPAPSSSSPLVEIRTVGIVGCSGIGVEEGLIAKSNRLRRRAKWSRGEGKGELGEG